MEVKSDEQVAARAHAFPADEEQQEIIREHQHQHGKHEEIQVAEEAVVAAFVRHVAGGVNVNQEADAGDDEDHNGGERVELEAPVGDEIREAAVEHVERNGGEPFEEDVDRDAIVLREREELQETSGRENKGDENAANAEGVDHDRSSVCGRRTASPPP